MNNIPFVGPAYFTKLIYFLGRKKEPLGFIVDQWTARSANLLSDKLFIHLTGGYTLRRKDGSILRTRRVVTRANNADTYERFCDFVLSLAQRFQRTGDQIEQAMFSYGGRNKGAWRNYVLENDS